MMVYAWLVSRMTGQESVPVTLFYTGRPEASTTQMIPRDEITNFEAELGGMIRGLRGEDYPANLAHCPSCPYARNGRCIRVPS
jgi:hypothetical protein